MVNCEAETKVVVRSAPLNLTTEPLMKLLPFTANVKAAPPARAEAGFKEAITGAGLLIVKFVAGDKPPPGNGLKTATLNVPANAISEASNCTLSCEVEIIVVVRSVPLILTLESGRKLLPLTSTVVFAAPAMTADGFKVIAPGAGLLMAKFAVPEMPPPGIGLKTLSAAEPALAMSGAVT